MIDTTSYRTIDQCRQLTADGELSAEDLWFLADWLNSNPECCDSWPGSELAPALGRIFENGSANLVELKRFAKILAAIERKICDLNIETAATEAVESFNPIVCKLPSLNLTLQIPSTEQPGIFYTVNLSDSSCTCPDWVGTRMRFPPLDFGRCCKHVAAGLCKCSPNDGWPVWLGAMLRNCTERDRGTNPLERWGVVQIRDNFALFSIGEREWINVFTLKDGYYSRFGYNLNESRWAYGDRPYLSRTIVNAIRAAL